MEDSVQFYDFLQVNTSIDADKEKTDCSSITKEKQEDNEEQDCNGGANFIDFLAVGC